MAHFWDDKDGNGNPLTDGRVCYVTRSDDPEIPEVRTYGKDKDEVLAKLATTVETGQATIHRLRKNAPAAPPKTPAPTTTVPASTTIAKAVTDLSNPATAPAAVKTLLAAAVPGFDPDKQARIDAAHRVADIAQAWEDRTPDYPKDPRNDQILMNRAALLAGGNLRITDAHIESAYQDCLRLEMFFEPKAPTVQPRGTEETRTGRHATMVRRNALRSTEPAAAPQEGAKEAKWRKILEDGTGRAMDDAIRAENAGNREYAGFQKFAEKLLARAS